MENKKKLMSNWINHPITRLYYKVLVLNKEALETALLNAARHNFNSDNIVRKENEINIHSQLIALDAILNDLKPLFDFVEYCKKNNLEIEEIGEKYKKFELGEDKETELSNPLDIFVNNLIKATNDNIGN
jgi:hypothetical protein